jgi:enoyl-CoA hydratase
MAEFISSEQDGYVAVVTIDHPPVNALSAPLLEELEAEVERLDADDSVRAVVLKGAGERAFVAGADISEFPSLRQAAAEAHESGSARGIQKLGAHMDAADTPFVAAIHGFCLGGGLELAMCCDIRVACEDAQLGQPEIKLGLIPGGGGTQRLPRLVGFGRALLLNLTGDFIDARTAYEWGLVEKVVPQEELLDTALGIARSIAARSPVSVAVLRELARTTRDLPLEEGLRREADGFRRCLGSEDGAEGVAAFLEKREPQFTGR